MPQGYYVRKITLQTGVRKGETVYAAQPHYFGTLTTEDMADQIASESAMTKGDVKNVMEGMQRYVRSSLAKGYKVELLGFGLVCNRFKTSGSVDSADKVSATLIKGIIPGFEPSFMLVNGRRRYKLLPERILLQKISFKGSTVISDDHTEELPGDQGDGGGDDGDEDFDPNEI